MKKLLFKKVEELSPPSQNTQTSECSPPKKKNKLMRHLNKAASTAQVSTSPAQTELDKYLNSELLDDDSKPLLYWKDHRSEFPLLCQLARRYLAVPASSAPVERLFSIAGKTFSKERSRLTDERFEQLMFIKCNKHFCN